MRSRAREGGGSRRRKLAREKNHGRERRERGRRIEDKQESSVEITFPPSSDSPGNCRASVFRRRDRSFPVRPRATARSKSGGVRKVQERRKSRSPLPGADRKRAGTTLLGHVEEAEQFCDIFLYPIQVTLSVSKKKEKKEATTLHYACKRILNVTVNCPYSKAPPPLPNSRHS